MLLLHHSDLCVYIFVEQRSRFGFVFFMLLQRYLCSSKSLRNVFRVKDDVARCYQVNVTIRAVLPGTLAKKHLQGIVYEITKRRIFTTDRKLIEKYYFFMKIVQVFENVNNFNGILIEKIFEEYLRIYDKFELFLKIIGKRIIKVNGFSIVRTTQVGQFTFVRIHVFAFSKTKMEERTEARLTTR